MDFGEIIKNIAPYVVSIVGSFWAYMQAKKKMNQELEIVKANNEHEINRLIEEHKINIEDLEKKHNLEMEAKEKAYEHEKEILELKLPENFEFLPVERSVVIRKERENKERYMSLLLEADPSEKLIRQYLADRDLFVLTYKSELVCVAVVTKVNNDTCELKNIVTEEKYRGKDYTRKMIKYLCDNYKQKYNKIIDSNK